LTRPDHAASAKGGGATSIWSYVTTGRFLLPSPPSSDTNPRSSSDLSIRDMFEGLRPVRKASSVMLRGGRRLISSSRAQF